MFVCLDCGADVYRAVSQAANDQDICVTCEWIRNIEDPAEREQVRKFLHSKKE
jgi:hypothetical protein